MANDSTIDLATVEAREAELQSRHDRQDSDWSDLYNLSAYELKNYENKKVPGSYPITSNRSRVFADRVISALQGCKLKVDVTIKGEASPRTTKIEEAIYAMWDAIDAYLMAMGYPDYTSFQAGQSALRGGISTLVYPYAEDGYLVPHLGLWDWRYVASSLGRKGLEWGSHRMTKTKAQVKKEHGIDLDDDDAEIVDLWKPRQHLVYVEDEVSKSVEPDTLLEYTPIVEVLVNLTAFVQDSEYQTYMGESVYAALRETYKERNRQLSIRNSLAMRALTNGLQYRSAQGEQALVNAKEALADMSVQSVEKDGGFDIMPPKDINLAAQEMLQKVDEDAVFAGLSMLEYGEMPDDLTAAQLNTVLSKTQSFLDPRRKAMERARDEIAYMFLGQIRDRHLPTKVRVGHRVIEIPSNWDLDEDVEIKHTLHVELPLQMIAKYSLNAAARGEVSQETRMRDILQLDDPEGEMQKLNIETLEMIDPRLKAFRIVQALLESKDEDEKAFAAYAIRLLGLQPQPPPQMAPGGMPGQGQPQMPGGPGQGQPPQGMPPNAMPPQGQPPVEPLGKGPMPSQTAPKPNISALPALIKGGA